MPPAMATTARSATTGTRALVATALAPALIVGAWGPGRGGRARPAGRRPRSARALRPARPGDAVGRRGRARAPVRPGPRPGAPPARPGPQPEHGSGGGPGQALDKPGQAGSHHPHADEHRHEDTHPPRLGGEPLEMV